MDRFVDLLIHNEEFAFTYEGVAYEIVYDPKLCLYLMDSERGTLLQSFNSHEDFMNRASINGKKVSEIFSKFIIP